MKVLLQRVREASVTVGGERIAAIGPGLLALLGVEPKDGDGELDWLVNKTLNLRVFPDEAKPMNRSLLDVGGALLLVSQFTLAGDTSRGNRPGFASAAPPELAERLYERFVERARQRVADVQTGRFGADMQVALVNDGPVTFLLER